MILRSLQKRVANNTGNNSAKNMDTKKILDAMEKMKSDIIKDRVSKDKAIMDKIDELDSKITLNVKNNTDRIVALEESNEASSNDIAKLFEELEAVKLSNAKLNDKLVNAVAHSRRLNLHFLGFDELKDEVVFGRVQQFLVNTLRLDEGIVGSMLIRDAHRLGVYKEDARFPRPIIVGFVKMSDRNLISEKAYLCKDTKFAIRVDLPPELVEVRKRHLEIKRDILKANPSALVSISTRSYLPCILVRYEGRVQIYKPDEMDIGDLQPGNRVRR